MEFSILERIILPEMLPQNENRLMYGIIQDFRKELSFSEQELKDLDFKIDGDNIRWNPEKEKLKEIEIGDTLKKLISDTLGKLDEERKINKQNVTLYDKFVINN